MLKCISISFASFFISYFVTTSSFAEETPIAKPVGGIINEHYDKTARVAGSRLVGIRLGTSAERFFDPANVQVVTAKSKTFVCVRTISRDGLYWMRTPYESLAASSAHPRMRLEPFTVGLGDTLRSYSDDDIAILAFASDDDRCLNVSGVLLPEFSSRAVPDRLELMINSGNRKISIQLRTEGEPVGTGCVAPENVERIAFDRLCSLPVALGGRPVDGVLEIAMDDGLSVERESYRIRFPAAP